jgi:hypothetical protein
MLSIARRVTGVQQIEFTFLISIPRTFYYRIVC